MSGSNGQDPIMQQPKQQPTPSAADAPPVVAQPDFRVPMETMNKLINYLAQHPWHEVNPLLAALSQCAPIAPPKGD
ncbi:MAG TPA: hypothetical protein VIV14_00975 [Gammaproteobacteria bacterium]